MREEGIGKEMTENTLRAPLTPPQLQGHTGFATSLALLLLRLTLGYVMFFHGAQKMLGWFGGKGIEAFAGAAALQQLPVLPPIAWAWMAASAEVFGGILLMVGLLTRLATLPVIVTMVVAILTVHGANGFAGFRDPVKGMQAGYEYNLVLITMATALLLTGPGLISADAFLFRRGLWARGPQPLENPIKGS